MIPDEATFRTEEDKFKYDQVLLNSNYPPLSGQKSNVGKKT
jgi:hypothetical protein